MIMDFETWCEKKNHVLKSPPEEMTVPKDITSLHHGDIVNLMGQAMAWQEFVSSYEAAFKARLLYCNYEKRKDNTNNWALEIMNLKGDLEKCKHLMKTYENYVKLFSREITRRTNLAQQELRYDKLTG